jgi:hypothetical protein
MYIMEKRMQKMWTDFSDFDLTQLCFDYGIEEECKFSEILPVTLSNRSHIEQLLTELEMDLAYAEVQ